ncbi:MAG: Rpn family recombination-promoting nuclease/putative transposase [Lachnospiraceae bacterium]
MGKIDTITKEYMKDPVIFADMFNKFLYHGKQVINPDNLIEMDTTEIAVPYGEGKAGVPAQKYRDVLKLMKTDGNIAYCILGCEDQSRVHYAMPVKNMLYDSMQYARQVTKAAKSHRQEKEHKPSSGEFLGGFYKTDRLIPVVTLVIYWGPDRWDGPLSLKEMYAAADDAIMQYVPDYKINLIAPEQMSDDEIKEFKSSLKEVMLYIKYSKDKAKLQEIAQEDPNFLSMDRQAAEVINVTTNSRLKYPEGKETINMCLAIEEMRNESRLEGEIKGAVETCKNFNKTLEETIQYISDNFTVQQAEEEVKKYWK